MKVVETETVDQYFYQDVNLKDFKYGKECRSRLKNLWVENVPYLIDWNHVILRFLMLIVKNNLGIGNVSKLTRG